MQTKIKFSNNQSQSFTWLEDDVRLTLTTRNKMTTSLLICIQEVYWLINQGLIAMRFFDVNCWRVLCRYNTGENIKVRLNVEGVQLNLRIFYD